MGSMRRKLRDNTGAMALFALAGFLLAAAVSFAIVTAAVNNANRVKGQQEEQRAYLAVTSAATLLRESLAGKSVTITQELDLSMDETTREYSGDDSALARAFADALLAAHLDGSTFTDEQLTLNVTDDLKMKVSTSYDGWRLSMKIEPMAEKYKGIAPPMTLTFDNVEGWNRNGAYVPRFELAGGDGKYVAVKAEYTASSKTIDLVVPAGLVPEKVAYMRRSCVHGFIKNEAGLPLGPFRGTVSR